MIFTADTYFQLRSRNLVFDAQDVAGTHEIGARTLRRDDIVLCKDIVYRKGGRGRGKYARLLYLEDGESLVLFHRVSKFGRGAGNWEELNPMMTLALAGEIPTL